MATKQQKRVSRTLPPLAAMRAWHVVMANGADATVTAQQCYTHDGVLSFISLSTIADESVLVRAFGRGAWHDVELVDDVIVTSIGVRNGTDFAAVS